MSSSPKQGTTTTIATQSPWNAPFQTTGNYIAQGLLARNDYQGYQGPFLADQSPYTKQAIDLQAQRGLNGSPLTSAYQQQLTDTLSGKYLDPSTNPYLSGAVNQALGMANSTYQGTYGGAAGTNLSNTGFQEGLTRTLANTALPFYSGAYQSGRQNQLQAAALAPNAIAQDYANIGEVQQAGASQDAYNQAKLQAAQQAYNAPWSNLANYMSIINGQGLNSSQQNPYFTNPLANALGLGTGALGLYKGVSGLFGTGAAADTGVGAGLGGGLSTAGSDAAANFGGSFGAAML